MRTAVILTPAREASRVETALQRQDPQDPVDPVDPLDPQECSFLLEFETPIELERLAISNERPLSNLSVSAFKNHVFDYLCKPMSTNIRFPITSVERVIKTYGRFMFRNHLGLRSASLPRCLAC